VLEVIFGMLEAFAMNLYGPAVRLYRRRRIALHRWRMSLRKNSAS
jgi:hypothetical protein